MQVCMHACMEGGVPLDVLGTDAVPAQAALLTTSSS